MTEPNILIAMEVSMTGIARVHGTITVEVTPEQNPSKKAREIAGESPNLVDWKISNSGPEDAETETPDVRHIRGTGDCTMGKYWINVYLTNRAYGGPEEGGWWYETGEFFEKMSKALARDTGHTCPFKHDARGIRDAVQKKLDEGENAGRCTDIYSVNSEGKFVALIETHDGRSWPTRRPHYS